MFNFVPNRATQPYRRSLEREQTPALSAMLLGRPAFMANPMDAQRQLQKRASLAALLMARYRP